MRRRGRTARGTQRWRCLRCGISFVRKNPAKRRERERVWFERWMRGGWSVAELARASGHSRWKARRIVREWLGRSSPAHHDIASVRHLIIDGTYLKGRDGIFIAMDGARNEAVAGAHGVVEGSAAMREFLADLSEQGLDPVSVTADGNRKVLAAVHALWPQAKIQRCVVHVQRQGLMWCRRNPKRADARILRDIFLRVTRIGTAEERYALVADVRAWEERYGAKIEMCGDKGWVSSDLRRARSMLLKALPDMFRYLDEPGVPNTTNCIEGYIGRMKEIYRLHRGLAKDRRRDYFRWHFHLNRR